MPKDLIALTCPQCGASLECDSTNMKIFCQYCGTPILIKDFITQRRIDNSDKIISYNNIINNAINKMIMKQFTNIMKRYAILKHLKIIYYF